MDESTIIAGLFIPNSGLCPLILINTATQIKEALQAIKMKEQGKDCT